MYLAATEEFMVSPSEIVDKVWHLHLIFTESYDEFCKVLGKHIQHIPSTHNKSDFQRFKRAQDRTKEYYQKEFGEQPNTIWGPNDMFDSLNLEKSIYNLGSFLNFLKLALVCAILPVYVILKPFYKTINGTEFIYGIVAITIVLLSALEIYNRLRLKAIMSQVDSSSFIFNLEASEVIYAKTQKLESVIEGEVNELVALGVIKANTDQTIEIQDVDIEFEYSKAQQQIVTTLGELGPVHYPTLVRNLTTKPIFRNILNCVDAIQQHVKESQKFRVIYNVNFTVVSIIMLLSFARIALGVMRDKPVGYLLFSTFILYVIIFHFLERLEKLFCTHALPNFYENVIIPKQNIEVKGQWRYFLFSKEILAATFIPVMKYVESSRNSGGSGGGCGGGSCGGGGCGGCGG
jgi:hypothetical protein